MRLVSVVATAAAVLFSSCASHELVRADDMSATQHRQEAQREREVADKQAAAGPAAPGADPGPDDWNAERRRQAERRREHSRQHAAAAEFLEEFEDRECRHVPAGQRAACPLLGPVVRIDDHTIGTGAPGSVTRQLINGLRKLIAREAEPVD